jgi:hypothetical protein
MHLMNTRLLFLLLCLFMAGCNEDDPPADPYNYYPLAVGHQWKYYYECQYSINGVNQDTSRVWSTWTVTGDTVINNEKAYIMSRIDSNANGSFCRMKTYYSNRIDGLYAHGYCNDCGLVWFKSGKPLSGPSIFNPFPQTGQTSDTVVIVDDPIHFLKYPVVIGEVWVENVYTPDMSTYRQWLGTETVETGIGPVECSKVGLFLDSLNHPMPQVQYISDKGFIMEELFDTLEDQSEHLIIHWSTVLQGVNF